MFIVLFFSFGVSAQDTTQPKPRKFTIDGYTTFLQQEITDSIWIGTSMFHNRVNLNYYPVKYLKCNFEMRTRLVYGEAVTMKPTYGDELGEEDRPLDLSFNLVNKASWVLNTMIDRASIELTIKKLQLTVGRQRINWSRTFVWNPNDIFNSYSYFDFDYAERIGVDAVRAVYYTGVSSQAEVVARLGKDYNMTYAGMYKWNMFNYDVQVIGSYEENEDMTLGLGFEGYVGSVSLRGETSYYKPVESNDFLSDGIIASIGADKSFKHDFMVQAEFMYNSFGFKIPENMLGYMDMTSVYNQELSGHNLSIDRFNAFLNISKQITPLISTSVAGLYYIENNMFYVGPNLDISLKENLKLSFAVQYFNIPINDERKNFLMVFGRLKHSF